MNNETEQKHKAKTAETNSSIKIYDLWDSVVISNFFAEVKKFRKFCKGENLKQLRDAVKKNDASMSRRAKEKAEKILYFIDELTGDEEYRTFSRLEKAIEDFRFVIRAEKAGIK